MAKPSKSISTNRRTDSAGAPSLQNRGQKYLMRADGWNNFLAAAGWNNKNTGRGIAGIDKRMATNYAPKGVVPEQTLRSLYRGDGTARRIIDLAVEAMTSQGFEIVGDPEGMILARMEDTGMYKSLEEMIRWSRLFGGSLGVINVDDGQLWDRPLNMNAIRKVYDVKVYNRWRCTFTTVDLYRDPANPKFGKPEFYHIQPVLGRRYTVHESRTVRMDGAPVDDLSAAMNQGWGDSYLQACFDSLSQLAGVYDACENIIDDFITSTVTMNELSELMAAPDGEKLVLKRLAIMSQAQAITNIRLLSENETFNKVASSISGLPEMVDRFSNKLAMDAGYPSSLLMGESPAGLNATGDADKSNFYDKMEAAQKKDMLQPIQYLTKLIFLSQDDYYNGVEPENWWVEFRKLWQPTAKEQADIAKTEADTICELVDRGVMDENEARDIPEIRNRYNLIGDAPEPDPVPAPLSQPPAGNGDPADTGKEAAAVRADASPEAAAASRADIMAACRTLITDSRGRRRADGVKYDAQTVILSKAVFPGKDAAKAWARDHGFRDDSVDETRQTYRFAQKDAGAFSPNSQKYLTLMDGVEITVARTKDG